jgi:ribosomal protein L29
MKKNELSELKHRDIKILQEEINDLRKEIVNLKLESKLSPPKDVNSLYKKRKKLAAILTIINEKNG